MHFRLLSSKKIVTPSTRRRSLQNFTHFLLIERERAGAARGVVDLPKRRPHWWGRAQKTSRTNEEGGGGGHHHHQTDWDETTRRRRRRKVAALHGRGGSARSFSKLLRKMVAETEESVEWTFLDGPIDEGKMHEFTKKENEKRSVWWALPRNTRTYGADVLDGIEESCEKVAREGLSDCFSQGATLSSVPQKMRMRWRTEQFESVALVSERDRIINGNEYKRRLDLARRRVCTS